MIGVATGPGIPSLRNGCLSTERHQNVSHFKHNFELETNFIFCSFNPNRGYENQWRLFSGNLLGMLKKSNFRSSSLSLEDAKKQ